MSVISNLKKRGLKDILKIRKIRIYLRYLWLKIKGTSYPELLVPEYREQITQRMANYGCRECIQLGECTHCGCPSPELFYDKDNYDGGGNWDEMDTPEVWREKNIPVDKDYLEQVEKYGVIRKFK